MSDRPSLLERYVGHRPPPFDSTAIVEEGEAEILGCFTLLRGTRERAVSLELRRRTGEILAIPYSYISRIDYAPAGGIRICCGNDTVHIRGSNLNREVRPRVTLFGGLARHAVPCVTEADRAASLQAPGDAVIVEAIEW